MNEVFERDVHNAIKKLVETNWVVTFDGLELAKKFIGLRNETVAYMLFDGKKSRLFDTIDEALREMSHIVDLEAKVTKTQEKVDNWNKDYGPWFKNVNFDELRKSYEIKCNCECHVDGTYDYCVACECGSQ